MEAFRNDLRIAVRSLMKRPGFTLAAVAALGLGIGASGAVWSVFDAAVLRPLPYPDPDGIVVLSMANREKGTSGGAVSMPDFRDWRELNRSFSYLAAVSDESFVVTGLEHPLRLPGAAVSTDFFMLFDLAPMRGHLVPEAWRAGQPSAVVSHDFWQGHLGGDEEVVGRPLVLDGRTYSILAVMPPELDVPNGVRVWLPLDPGEDGEERDGRFLNVLGRLRPEVTPEQATAEMEGIALQLSAGYPETNDGLGIALVSLHEQLTGELVKPLLTLQAAIGFVLLIVCANVSSLLLARLSARLPELRIRAALGATGRVLARQLWTESLLLAVAGGVVGLFLGLAGGRLFLTFYPVSIHGARGIGLSWGVAAFYAAMVLGATLLYGFLPTVQGARKALAGSLQEGAARLTASAAARRTQGLVLVFQVAVALVLLFGAGLLINSLVRLLEVDPGFRPQGLLTARVALPTNRYTEKAERGAFFEELLESLEHHPQVRTVAAATHLPLSGSNMRFRFDFDPSSSEEKRLADYRAVSPDYFRTMGVPFLRGRDFGRRDGFDGPPVAIVNREFVRRFGDGADLDLLGRQLRLFYGKDAPREIVGVVADMKHFGLGQETRPEIYVPHAQHPWPFLTLVLRTDGDPMALAPIVRAHVAALDDTQPVDRLQAMEEMLVRSVGESRFYSLLLGGFALVALLTAAVGIYGVSAYWVGLRRPEAGVRMAMGAKPADVMALFVRQPLGLALAGTVLGGVAALAAARLLSGWLYGVDAADPWTLLAVAGLLLLTAALASYLPARQMLGWAPASILRND